MKKIIIISAILLFVVSLHAQRNPVEKTRRGNEKQKSEAAVSRSAEQKNSRPRPAHTGRQVAARDISHANRSRTSTAKSHTGNRAAGNRSQAMKSTYEKPTQGQVHRGSAVSKGRTSRDRTPGTGRAGTYRGQKPSSGNGYKSPGNKTTVRSSSHSQRNNQSVHGTSSGKASARTPAARTHAEYRKQYATPNRRAVRTNHVIDYHYHYNPVRYRNVHYHYYAPKRIHVTWTRSMYRDYRIMYPDFRYWYYPVGYQIVTIPFYQAYYHVGEVRNVYGKVHEVYYSWSTDEYYLYFGGSYPYHDFTVIISGRDARRFDRQPEWFFEGRYMWVTGLLSTFEGRPELIVKRRHQIHLY